MEHFFGGLEGGYAQLIVERRVGFPAVHVEIDFAAPARYGDTLRIETRVVKVGNRSAVLAYRMFDARSSRLVCALRHTVVTSDLRTLTSCDMPADVRALLEAHLEPPA
jgi:4-hydroxybenzoyl-CoA thioesterase